MVTYNIFSSEPDAFLGVNFMGISADTAVTRFGPGKRSSYIIHYVISGRGYYNGTPVGAGQGFLIYPGDREEYHCDKSDPWEFLWIVAKRKEFEYLMDACEADSVTKVFSYDFIPEVRSLGEKIKLEKNSPFSAVECAELVCSLMKHHVSGKKRRRVSSSRDYALIAREHIRNNYAARLSVEGICGMLGISQPYLYKIFTAEYGISPRQYITRVRITEAKRLLSEGGISVSEAARAVGFEDALAFTRCFRKYEGICPTRYKKSNE